MVKILKFWNYVLTPKLGRGGGGGVQSHFSGLAHFTSQIFIYDTHNLHIYLAGLYQMQEDYSGAVLQVWKRRMLIRRL